jgi:chorismate dehydratase
VEKEKIYRVGIISYTNVLPFLYGLNKLKNIKLIDEYPSRLVPAFMSDEYDLVLLPTGALNKTKEAKIVSSYCIGADGEVASVCLYSNKPIESLKKIYLDYQSATSVRLFKILAKKYFKKEFIYLSTTDDSYIENIEEDSGILVIGDRTFGLGNRYIYVYDLSELWKRFTGLPFVFAVWVTKEELTQGFVNEFDKALREGVDNIEKTIMHFKGKKDTEEYNFLLDYLKNKISYQLDDKKKESINLFLNYLEELGL